MHEADGDRHPPNRSDSTVTGEHFACCTAFHLQFKPWKRMCKLCVPVGMVKDAVCHSGRNVINFLFYLNATCTIQELQVCKQNTLWLCVCKARACGERRCP